MATVWCFHHDHRGEAAFELDEPAVWAATDRHGIDLGEFCADHLGDGIDGFDGDVHLTRVNV